MSVCSEVFDGSSIMVEIVSPMSGQTIDVTGIDAVELETSLVENAVKTVGSLVLWVAEYERLIDFFGGINNLLTASFHVRITYRPYRNESGESIVKQFDYSKALKMVTCHKLSSPDMLTTTLCFVNYKMKRIC
jgi:hypothetical protein